MCIAMSEKTKDGAKDLEKKVLEKKQCTPFNDYTYNIYENSKNRETVIKDETNSSRKAVHVHNVCPDLQATNKYTDEK